MAGLSDPSTALFVNTKVVYRTVGKIAGAVRASVAAVGALCALLGAPSALSLRWLVPAVVVFVAWTGVYATVAWRRGLNAYLVLGDVTSTVALCVAMRWLVATEAWPGGSSWVSNVA